MPKIKTVVEVDVPHRVGNLYWSHQLGCHCILAQIQPFVVSLIGLDDTANRVVDGLRVNNIHNITEEEFAIIRGSFDMECAGLYSSAVAEDCGSDE